MSQGRYATKTEVTAERCVTTFFTGLSAVI
jgi:hypothetical protein